MNDESGRTRASESEVVAAFTRGDVAPGVSGSVYGRLSLMMLLQYAVWGAWFPFATLYLGGAKAAGGLGFSPGQVGALMGVGASIGAITGPFIAGQFADRFFSTERFLAVSLALGGLVKWITAAQTDYTAWLLLSIAYSVIYMPTLALTNSLAFAHLTDRSRQFPYVRVWGTIGWIVASWAFPMIWLQTNLELTTRPPFLVGVERSDAIAQMAWALRFSAILSWVYAAFCLFLPHTPPRRDAVEPLAFAKAFRLLREPSVLLIVLVSLPISMIHQIYFIVTQPFLVKIGVPASDVGPALTIGQFAELLIMPCVGYWLKWLGFRRVIVIGALAYFLRFAIFGIPGLPTAVVLSSLVLHGLCYSCFFAAAYIYMDRVAPPDIRHSAQTLIGILILGIGPVFGGLLYGQLAEIFTSADGALNYSGLWYALAAIGGAAALLIALLFREKPVVPELAP